MGRIKILESVVRDQIAAGEVVERPSSVVKELVENSLDAGAGRISIEIEEGGRRLIRVVDDGAGMSRDDLELCLERFATSKLSTSEQIASIATMGFRGEALPSIASVSRLTITSRQTDSPDAWRLSVEGGEKSPLQPVAGAPGTVVDVRDLFFNVPARMKFLKSVRAEVGRISSTLTSLAIARPDVAFTLLHGDKKLLEVPAVERLADRIAALFTAQLVENLAEAEAVIKSGARVHGLISMPTEHRGRSSDIHVFVNGRPIRDKAVSVAVNQAYSSLLPLRRFPVVFLFMEFPAGDVDINVHPAKAEVRFLRQGEVFELLKTAVRKALTQAELAAGGAVREYGHQAEDKEISSSKQIIGEEPGRSEIVSRSSSRPKASRPRFTPALGGGGGQKTFDLWSADAASSVTSTSSSSPSPASSPAPESLPVSRDNGQAQAGSGPWRYLGQAHNGFLVVERDQGLLVVDQHALHERLIFEELRAARGAGPASQGLVIPQTVELSARHAEILRGACKDLQDLGFDIEEFGSGSFLVRSVPVAIKLTDIGRYLEDVAEDFAQDSGSRSEGEADSVRDSLLASVACKAAIKAGERLSPAAAEGLLKRALDSESCGALQTCPHGRPVCFLLDRNELARRVGRK
jgi:DNA mismatch repair protein MutL